MEKQNEKYEIDKMKVQSLFVMNENNLRNTKGKL